MSTAYSQFRRRGLALLIPSAAEFGTVQAAPSIANGSRLYAGCGGCHAVDASGSTDGVVPNLAGQDRDYLARQIAAFRSGARVDSAQLVATHATVGDPDAVAALTAYLSRLDWNPSSVNGSGDDLRRSREVNVALGP
jgi:cytochrome c553